MIEPFFLVALPVGAICGLVVLLWWRRQRVVPPSLLEEGLAVALAYALGLIALHRAAAPLGVGETPLFLAAAAGGLAFFEGSLTERRALWLPRVCLVLVAVYVVLTGAYGVTMLGVGELVRMLGYSAVVTLVWVAGAASLPKSGGARPLLLALATGAGVSALSTTMGAGPAMLAGIAIGLVALVAHLAAPRGQRARDRGVYALVGALWVAALVHS